LPYFTDRQVRLVDHPSPQLDESLDEGRIREAMKVYNFQVKLTRLSLLHGDYWPGNILWKDGQLKAILDWEDAATGEPLTDLANARLEVLWAFGYEAMELFTAHYKASMPELNYGKLAYWDLLISLKPMGKLGEWADSLEREQKMREGHKAFVAQALYALRNS
jgi:aminoglycoside phosphotransferase (APT) family kinase protein